MNDFQYKLARFFYGRRGTDQLNLFLLLAGFLLQIVGRLFNISIVSWIGYFAIIWSMFRMLSKNIPAREAENQKFLSVWYKITGNRGNRNNQSRNSYNQHNNYNDNRDYYKHERDNTSSRAKKNSKTGIQYCYYHCPQCKQQLRVPAGNGRIRITCPHCKSKFELTT